MFEQKSFKFPGPAVWKVTNLEVSSTGFSWSYPPQEPKFCKTCGKQLEVEDRRKTIYDEQTGVPYKTGFLVLSCPDWTQEGSDHTYKFWEPTLIKAYGRNIY